MGQLAAPGYRHNPPAGFGRLSRGLDDLRRVAAGRQSEHQGLLVYIRRGLIALHHHYGQGHERPGSHRQQVAGESARTHAQHQYVGDL